MHWFERNHRRKAFNEPGHAHELTFCCVDRLKFFESDRFCLWLSDAIQKARQKHRFALWTYVFMPDHVHILLYPQQIKYDVAYVLKEIKEPVGRKAIAILRKENPELLKRMSVLRGSRVQTRFWQPGGGYDRNLFEASTLRHMIDYIHLNPVRKQLVEFPNQWKWSSAGWFNGEEPNNLRPDPIPAEWGLSTTSC